MRHPVLPLVCLMPLATGCASVSVTTTVLPPHRLERPVCASAALVPARPEDAPPGGRLLARLRVSGGDLSTTSDELRRRLQAEAGKLGANRVLAVAVTTPGTLAALGMTAATAFRPAPGSPDARNDQATNPNQATSSSAPVPTDPNYYGRGLAYAIFVPDDTLRTNLECPPGAR